MTETQEPSKGETQEEITKERLVEALKCLGYKVTNQSTDGTWTLIRLPDGISTQYWIFDDRIEHRLDDHRGGSWFGFKDCFLLKDDDETVAIVLKNSPNHSTFIQFHNFKSHRNPHPGRQEKK